MTLTLYTNPQSRGRIARWMVEETGAPYEAVILDYSTTMKDEGYRAINPMLKVPAIRHDDRIVTECAAICAYLAEAFPEAELDPRPGELADYYRWLFFAAGPLEQAVTNASMGVTPNENQQRMVGYGDFARVIDVLEQAVGRAPYIAGDRFTAADVYVGSGVMWYTQFGLVEKRPVFLDYIARLQERPAYRRAAEKDDAALAAAASGDQGG
ncbi:glutathione S-transferase [Sphingomonas metalli]|uniref:Glutathione S-transferase n=1 Tax=Sphingomonas metalli TaxID=1779358 RepID=A0A916WPA2_9SPHN|nr:glutathione S-transferase family protein [Sphingomonas metalli]GGB17503.1 glutathione S-transferase [Sphingomonas metalli]